MAVKSFIRSAWYSAWLGWKLETNWADPLTFAGYYLLRPFASLLIVGFIFVIGSFAGGNTNTQYFTYLFLGQIAYVYVLQITVTTGYFIHEERAKYETLRSVYVTPTSIRPYLLGRALSAAFASTVSLLLTIVFGTIVFSGLLGLNLEIDLFRINYAALVMSLTLGIVSLISTGFILSGINLVSTRLQMNLSEYVSGIFFLLGDVIFPPTTLPYPLYLISYVLPVTYYTRAVRASIIDGAWDVVIPNLQMLLLMAILTTIVGSIVFAAAEKRAKRLGVIDRKSEY
ncbi:MAG: ABC transporter permease [Thaumarchaeota archaeon]|nr:ABC transporter permease [Nitrososphaerota archaeon]